MFSFDFVQPAWLLVCCIAIGAVGAWLLYQRRPRGVQGWRWWVLLALRGLTLTVVSGLLLQPIFTVQQQQRQAPTVAVLVDDSQSMMAGPDSAQRRQAIAAALQGWQTKLAERDVALQYYTLGNQWQAWTTQPQLRYQATETNMSMALQAAQTQLQNQHHVATVLISDGIYTAGENPVYAAERNTQPVYTVLVGDTTLHRDAYVESVLHNEIAFVNAETPVTVSIGHNAFGGSPITLRLLQNGKLLQSHSTTLLAGQVSKHTFYLRMTEPGLQTYTVELQPLAGEYNYRNNQQTIYIQVQESRVRVRILAGGPHPDVGALQAALAHDARYSVQAHIHKDENSYYEAPTAADLQQADVVVLHNYPASVADAPIMAQLAAEVQRRQLPIWYVMGLGTRMEQLGALAEYVPVQQTGRIRSGSESFLNLLPNYSTHSTLPTHPQWVMWQATLPPLLRPGGDWVLRGNATSYASSKIRGVVLSYPTLVMGEAGGAKNMAWIGEGLWRYRMDAYNTQGSFAVFDEWMAAMLQYLVVREDKRPFRVSTTKQRYAGGERVVFRGQAYDQSLKAITGAEIKLTITDSAGLAQETYMREESAGNYLLELANQPGGRYRYQAVGSKAGQRLGTDQGSYTIGQGSTEYVRLQADAPLLRQLARRTSGAYFTMNKAGAVADSLLALPAMRPLVRYVPRSQGLQRYAWPLLLLLLLLSTEWVLRKRWGML